MTTRRTTSTNKCPSTKCKQNLKDGKYNGSGNFDQFHIIETLGSTANMHSKNNSSSKRNFKCWCNPIYCSIHCICNSWCHFIQYLNLARSEGQPQRRQTNIRVSIRYIVSKFWQFHIHLEDFMARRSFRLSTCELGNKRDYSQD